MPGRVTDSFSLPPLLVFGFVTLIIFIRSYHAFTLPVLACEDGGMMLSYYTNHPSPVGIIRVYFGYVSLLPNLIAYLTVRLLPATLVPYVLSWYPLVLSGAVYSLLSLRRFRALIPSDTHRTWLCLFLALMPLGVVILVSNTTYSIWHLLLLLILLVIVPTGTSYFGNAVQFVLMALAAVSIPVSVVVAPLCIYNVLCRRRRADRLWNGALLGVIFSYMLLGVRSEDNLLGGIGLRLYYTMLYVLDRVIFEAVLGYKLRLALFYAQKAWVIHTVALGICALLAGLVILRRRKFKRPDFVHVGILCYLIIGITAIAVITRRMDAISHMGEWNIRYFYVQHLLFWILVALIMTKSISWPNLPRITRLFVGVGLITYALVLYSGNAYLYRASITEGRKLATFLQQVDADVSTLAPGESAEFLLQRPCFDIYLRYSSGPA